MKPLVLVCFLFIGTQAFAAETLSAETHQILLQAQEDSRKGENQKALGSLENYLKRNTFTAYERATLLQQTAFTWVEVKNFAKAIALLKQALAQKAFSQNQTRNLQFSLVQIYIADEKYNEAIAAIKAWLREARGNKNAAYALLAQALALSGDIKQATPYAEKAVQTSKRPRPSWLYLLISLYTQQNKYQNALKTAERGIQFYPHDRILWSQLAGLYGLLKKEKETFTTLRTMFALNLLENSVEWEQLAHYYLAYGAPLRAAQVLEQGFQQKKIEESEKNYTLLGDAWTLAQEHKRATEPLRKAAAIANTGEGWQKLGVNYAAQEQWEAAEQSLSKALGKVDEESEKGRGRAWLLLGVARTKQGKKDAALTAFLEALNYDKVSTEAKSWLSKLRTEL